VEKKVAIVESLSTEKTNNLNINVKETKKEELSQEEDLDQTSLVKNVQIKKIVKIHPEQTL